MIRFVGLVAGAAVGAIGTLVVQHPKKVAEKLHDAATFVVTKLCEAFPGEGPGDGAEGQA